MTIDENLESQARRIRRNRILYYYLGPERVELRDMACRIRRNRILYNFYIRAGVEYLINPDTDELHRVRLGRAGVEYLINPDTDEFHRVDLDYFEGSHNLATAHLENFIPCKNVDYPPVHLLSDDEEVLLYDFLLDELICRYRLDKCEYCFPR